MAKNHGEAKPLDTFFQGNVTSSIDAAVPADDNLRLFGVHMADNATDGTFNSCTVGNGALAASHATIAAVRPVPTGSHTVHFPGGKACPNGISVLFIAGDFNITLMYKNEP